MKRDMDLIRRLMQEIEQRAEYFSVLESPIEGVKGADVKYHLVIMNDAGLIDGLTDMGDDMLCQRLTWAGHEFIEASRSDTLWNNAKEQVVKTTGALSFEVLVAYLKYQAKEKLGLDI